MTGTALAFPTPASLGSLDHYIQAVNRFPLLTAEQEVELGRRLQRDDDIDAARQLVLSHLRLVVAVSRKYLGYGLPQADLIQEGNIGLMKAVRRFDPERGVRLVSFALHWIRAEIHEYILRNWRLVKIATTKAQRKLFFNLRSMKPGTHALTPSRGEGDREGARRQARGGRRDGDAAHRPGRRARPAAGRRRRHGHADRLPDRRATTTRRRSTSARETGRSRTQGLKRALARPRRAQPPHHRGALAARGRPGDAAGPRRRVRRVRRAHPPDREQGAAVDARADRRRLTRDLRDATTLAAPSRVRLPARQSSTCVPSSTTRLVGMWKKSVALTAFRDIDDEQLLAPQRHARRAPSAISVSRETKNDVSIMSNSKPCAAAGLEQRRARRAPP